jgi:hypothetical protein
MIDALKALRVEEMRLQNPDRVWQALGGCPCCWC